MTFDPTKPVQTRDGRPARIICTDRKCPDSPIVALITGENGNEILESLTADGRLSYNFWPSSQDIVNVPEEVHRWINVYTLGLVGCAHESREEADEANERLIGNTAHKRTAIIQITLADGRVKKFVIHDM